MPVRFVASLGTSDGLNVTVPEDGPLVDGLNATTAEQEFPTASVDAQVVDLREKSAPDTSGSDESVKLPVPVLVKVAVRLEVPSVATVPKSRVVGALAEYSTTQLGVKLAQDAVPRLGSDIRNGDRFDVTSPSATYRQFVFTTAFGGVKTISPSL